MELAKDLQVDALMGYSVRDVSESSRPLAESVLSNLRAMRDHYLDFVHGIALRDFSRVQEDALRTKNENRFKAQLEEMKNREGAGTSLKFPEVNNIWSNWGKLAVNASCLALRNYVFALEPVQGAYGRIPEWQGRIDAGELRKARKAFNARFPQVEKARHSIAHPESFDKAEHRHSVSGNIQTKDGKSIIVSNGSNITIKHGQFGNNFGVTFDGQFIEIDMSRESAEFLRANYLEVIDIFNPVLRWLWPETR